MRSIVFTGGGTAGHIMPNLALIEELKNKYKIYYLGTDGMEKKLTAENKNINFIEINAVKFKRSITPENLLIPFKLISSINKIKKIFKKIKPSIVFSKGGFVSLPVCISANKLNIPVITHESDLSIGLANKIIGKKAKCTCCSFKKTAENIKNGIYTGSPIRKKIFNGNKNIIMQRHNLSPNLQTILIVGGSQGASAINNIIWENIDKLTNKYNVIHIVGKNNIKTEINIRNYIQIEFSNDIENYFDASNVVISRAGSNTIFELLSLCKPMILIPLPKTKHSRGDQVDNANYFKSKNFANVIYQNNLNSETLLRSIENTLKDKQKLIDSMKNANNNIGTQKIINIIEKYIL